MILLSFYCRLKRGSRRWPESAVWACKSQLGSIRVFISVRIDGTCCPPADMRGRCYLRPVNCWVYSRAPSGFHETHKSLEPKIGTHFLTRSLWTYDQKFPGGYKLKLLLQKVFSMTYRRN